MAKIAKTRKAKAKRTKVGAAKIGKVKPKAAKTGKAKTRAAKTTKARIGRAKTGKDKTKRTTVRSKAMPADSPPYKCETTDEPGVCLRFNRNPRTGQYNLPPGGIRVQCTDCENFFD
jgi:hypothetical protein